MLFIAGIGPGPARFTFGERLQETAGILPESETRTFTQHGIASRTFDPVGKGRSVVGQAKRDTQPLPGGIPYEKRLFTVGLFATTCRPSGKL